MSEDDGDDLQEHEEEQEEEEEEGKNDEGEEEDEEDTQPAQDSTAQARFRQRTSNSYERMNDFPSVLCVLHRGEEHDLWGG